MSLMIGPVFYQSAVYWASLHEIMPTVMELWTTEQEVKRACWYSRSSSRFSGTLSFLCSTFRWLCLSRSLSVSFDIQVSSNLLSFRSSLIRSSPSLSIAYLQDDSPYLNTRYFLPLSEAQEPHAALRIADNLQVHTRTYMYFILPRSHADKCVYGILAGTRLWHLEVCMPLTTQLSQQSRKICTRTWANTYWYTCTADGYLSCPQYSGHWW